jgi:hypothetical protein
MKFLCVSCDQPMKLDRTEGPHDGSMTVVFQCPGCGWEAAMLTNVMETQMVRSLGVKIGGRTAAPEPMEMVRGSLHHGRDSAQAAGASAPHAASLEATGEATGSKCPFTGMVESAFAKQEHPIVWTKEAEERIARVPPFARPMVQKGIEMHAIERGYREITDGVIDEVKDRFGM